MNNKNSITRQCKYLNEARRVKAGSVTSDEFFCRVTGDLLISGKDAGNMRLVENLVHNYFVRDDLPTIVLTSHMQLTKSIGIRDRKRQIITSRDDRNYMPFYNMDAQQIIPLVSYTVDKLGYSGMNSKVLLYCSSILNIVVTQYPLSLPAITKLLEEDDDFISGLAIHAGLSNVVADNIRANHEAGIILRRVFEYIENVFGEVYEPGRDSKYNFQSAVMGNVTNTYRGMILEVGRHPNNESIIQMPGLRIGNNFYFDVVSDSGINAIYTPTCCEKDHVYADHLSTRIAENYDFSKGKMTVSQVHRHPDGCIHFSSGDFEANSNLAKQYGGVVNGLMFVDPEFRLKFWYIDENGKETEAEYEINDRAVMEAMPFVEIEKIKSEVEKREALKKTCENDKLDEDMDFATSIEDMKPFKVLIPEEFRKQEYEGTLIGYYIPETKTYNILRRSGKPEAGAVRLGTAYGVFEKYPVTRRGKRR